MPISATLRQGPHFKSCSGGESLATCGRFDRLRIWTPYLSYRKRTAYHLCHLAGTAFLYYSNQCKM